MKMKFFAFAVILAAVFAGCQEDEIVDPQQDLVTDASFVKDAPMLKSLYNESEPNNVYYQADLITFTTTLNLIKGVLEPGGTVYDWIYFDVPAGGMNVWINFQTLSPNYITGHLYNSTMSLKATFNDNTTVTKSLTEGRYYLEVDGYSNNEWAYLFRLN